MNFCGTRGDVWVDKRFACGMRVDESRDLPVQIALLYEAHGAALLRYLRHGFGRYGSAEDMLQETFVSAMRAGDRCVKARSPRAFLFGVARHVGLSARRQSGRRQTTPLTEENVAAPAVDGRIAEMRRAIEELPEAMREALELRLREQLSYEEIADVLEIPVGTVRSRLHAAVKQLRKIMTEAE